MSMVAISDMVGRAGQSAGDGILAAEGMWRFNGSVATHFDEHVAKSIPFYHEGHTLICGLSDFFVGGESICYEIGCSTATLLSQLARRHAHKSARFIGVEIEQDMVKIATEKCERLVNVSIHSADALAFDFQRADFIVAYYTLQFIPPKSRQVVVNRIFNKLNRGGALVVFDKTRAPDARFQDILSQLFIDHKLEHGYSAEEILAKARSLKRVLEPFTSEENVRSLRRAGFVSVTPIMKYLCFEGLLAIR